MHPFITIPFAMAIAIVVVIIIAFLVNERRLVVVLLLSLALWAIIWGLLLVLR